MLPTELAIGAAPEFGALVICKQNLLGHQIVQLSYFAYL